MKLLLKAALALSLLASPALAQPADDWVVVKAGNAFTFEAPPDLKAVPVQGIDSLVGEYRGDRFSLQFDYGHMTAAGSRLILSRVRDEVVGTAGADNLAQIRARDAGDIATH